ncbi:hypothetical protein CRG98_042318 [Punica granatum]|uniref:Uncharacterized protein n=1 Tax=Punica granatum TaxID=22663 RepID=A0A2I0HZZ9_PUNGR|nr:hypothetical protein CRG98_042318 [Punica granatum]
MQESKLARVSKPGKIRQGCKRHEGGTSVNLRCRKVISHGLADLARLKEARARWLGEIAMQENPARLKEARARWLGERTMQESKLARVSRPGKVARGTSEVAQRTCGAGKHERGGSANLRRKKLNSHGLADRDWLQEAPTRWLGEFKVQESKIAQLTRQGCKRHERGGSANLRCRKVSFHGLADRARLQEARARLIGELAVQEFKLAWVSRPSNVARCTRVMARVCRPGKVEECTREVSQRTCGAGKKVSFHGLADRARFKILEGSGSANFRCQKLNLHGLTDPARLKEARARWLGELSVEESKLARVSRPGKVARGTSETGQGCKILEGSGSANFRCQKLNLHGLTDPARLKEARARWLGELSVEESKLARVSRPGKVARGTSKVARRTCGAGKHERGGSVNLRCKKLNSHGLTDPARLKEARGRWLSELAMQESKLARISRSGKVARGTREIRQGCKRHEGGGSANLRCKKLNSHGLTDPARLKEARARWLGELTDEESKLTRVSRADKVARGTSEVARRTCGGGKLADLAMLQEARARWPGEHAVEEIKLTRVSKPSKVERGRSEVAQRTCGGGK